MADGGQSGLVASPDGACKCAPLSPPRPTALSTDVRVIIEQLRQQSTTRKRSHEHATEEEEEEGAAAMDDQERQVVREHIAGLLVQFPGEARAWAQTIEEEAFKAAQDDTRYFETISRRLAALASSPPSELAGLPANAPTPVPTSTSATAEDEAQQPPQKKKNLGRRPNPKRPDKVPIAFILPAPVATRPVSQQAPRDRAVPRDLWRQTLHSYQAPLDALVTKTRTRAEGTPPTMMNGKDGAHRQQLLELLQQMQFAQHVLHSILSCGLAPPTAQNDKVCQDLLDRIAEWLLWDVNGGPLFPTMGPTSTMNTTTTTTASTPSEPAKRKRRASADDHSRAARRTRKSRSKSGSSPSSPAATQRDYAAGGAPAVAHDAPRGLFPFHSLLVEAEEGKLAAEGRISPRCVSALTPAAGLAILPLSSPAGPAIRSPTSAFTPWGEKRRSSSQAEDELSAATAIEALSSNRPPLLPSPVKKEPVDSSEVSESEGEDGEDVREVVESDKPSRRGKKRSAKHEDASESKKKERLSKRRLKTPQQLEILETEYAITRFPNTAKRQAISVATGLTPRGVQIWFQNKRAKDKFFESSAQKYMAKREVPSSGQHAGGASGASHYQALLPTPIVADAHFPLLGATPLPRTVSLPPIPAPPHYPQRQHQHPPPILPPLSSLSPPRPRSSSSPAHVPLLPPISSLPAFSLMQSGFAEPGTTSSSRSSSPLSCPLNLVNVPPNFSSPSASRSASPSSYQQLPHVTGGGGGSPMDLNTLISSLNNTINFLTALHSIAPSTQTSSPVCAWQGEIVWQGIVPVAPGSGPEPAPSSSGGALPRLYSCQVSIPLVCLSSDRNCISVMERCAAQMSVASMHPRGDRAYENVIESSEQAGTVLEFLPSSEGARQSVAFLLDQLSSAPALRSAQLATVNVDSRHQLVLFAAQGRLLGCLANLTCSPAP